MTPQRDQLGLRLRKIGTLASHCRFDRHRPKRRVSLVNAIAAAPGWIIHVSSPAEPTVWKYVVAISDSLRAVEAVRKLRAFPMDVQFIVKSQLPLAHIKALRLKDGQVHLRRTSAPEPLAAA